jgi:hypothetical protein
MIAHGKGLRQVDPELPGGSLEKGLGFETVVSLLTGEGRYRPPRSSHPCASLLIAWLLFTWRYDPEPDPGLLRDDERESGPSVFECGKSVPMASLEGERVISSILNKCPVPVQKMAG